MRRASAFILSCGAVFALLLCVPPSEAQPSAARAPVVLTAEQDHQNMMDQLGITALRPGPSGDPNAPNHANYDEATANPFPNWPDILTLRNGRPVTTPLQWQTRRREIVEDLEREVLGRVPAHTPHVNWIMASSEHALIGQTPALARRLVGEVDNRAYPAISVNLQAMLLTPANAQRPVPVLIMFAFLFPPGATVETSARNDPRVQRLLASGWGVVLLDAASVQADNGAGLTRGIIGLVNHGRPRRPQDWGALRAWAWGASRTLDYLRTDPAIDGAHVGIEGVSRYGKAALVTMAFDQRFAMVLVGSSGEGGASPYRRNFGEAVENLAGTGEYHWMAGNFLKYAASAGAFGSKNANDLPVDSHELIALCAPRLVFISYGLPEAGDAHWLDHQGSFMATVAAGAVWRLLGAHDLGVTDDYRTTHMPPVNTDLLAGQLAWRQHNGGHTDAPNIAHFVAWAAPLIGYAPLAN